MSKYLTVFKTSLFKEIVYPTSFIIYRLRNILQILLLYFLWSSVFQNPNIQILGYDRAKILTYIFGILILKSLVFSSRSVDVAGDISQGDLINYLLKPINYMGYWFTRDLSSKLLNVGFSLLELGILFLILKPSIFLQGSALTISAFVFSIIIAIILYFFILMLTNMTSFWVPEASWSSQFLILVVIVEFLSGAVFPIDVFPAAIQKIIYLTPFPYLIFFPLQVFLGKVSGLVLVKGFATSLFWLGFLYIFTKIVWGRGLRRFEAIGR